MNSLIPTVNKRVVAPKIFRPSTLIGFINSCEFIFKINGRQENGFLLDLTKVTKVRMLPILVIYKIIEYSFNCKCFNRPMIAFESEITKAFNKYGFMDLIATYMAERKALDREYKNLKISVSDNFIIAPQALLRNGDFSSRHLNKKYLPQIEEYYSFKPRAVSMIFLVFSEVLLNFWEHAVDDTKSIIVANGNRSNIEIACADTGNGIVSTLGKSINKSVSSENILLEAVKKGVTSKKMTNHMGYGLWILDEVVSRTKGSMHLYSEGAYYYNENGRKRSGTCGFWKGTIIYISLPLDKPITLSDIESEKQNLSIDWI